MIGVVLVNLDLLVRLVRLAQHVASSSGFTASHASVSVSERKRKKERTVDALALGGEEGRGKLR